ncbi:MAG: hypothetical protein ACXVQS_09670 [Actinomycetota bacterium]
MDPVEAAMQVLREDPGAQLHWTVIFDRALKAGYIDPFTQPDAREALVSGLAGAARAGRVKKTSKGTYSLTDEG